MNPSPLIFSIWLLYKGSLYGLCRQPFKYWNTIISSPLSFFPKAENPSSPSLLPYGRFPYFYSYIYGPSVDPHQPLHFFCVCVAPFLCVGTVFFVPGVAWQVLSRVRQWLFCFAGGVLVDAAWHPTGFLLHSRTIHWPCCPRTSRVPFHRLVPQTSRFWPMLIFSQTHYLGLVLVEPPKVLITCPTYPSVSAGWLPLMKCPHPHPVWDH